LAIRKKRQENNKKVLFKRVYKRLKDLNKGGCFLTGKKSRDAEAKKQLAEMKETAQRLQADFENFSKRVENEKEAAKEQGFVEAVGKMLPLLDSINSALEKAGGDCKAGLGELQKQAMAIMKGIGVEGIECTGKNFDSGLCEAMVQGKDESKENGVVLEEIQKGYMLHGKVLRHAKVKVNRIGE